MKLIYIASPYTIGDVEKNVRRQIDAAHVIMDLGHAPVAPLLSHFLHLVRERHYDEWMAIDLVILKRCDVLLRLHGESKGADIEVETAKINGIPVCFGFDHLLDHLVKTQQ